MVRIKPGRITRDPVEWYDLIVRWQKEAREQGLNLHMSDIKRQMAFRLKNYKYQPVMAGWRGPDLYEVIFGSKKNDKQKR